MRSYEGVIRSAPCSIRYWAVSSLAALSEKSAIVRTPRVAKERQPGQIANEDAVGPVLGQRAENAHLVRLLNPRRGQKDRRRGLVCRSDRLAIFADVLEIGIDSS